MARPYTRPFESMTGRSLVTFASFCFSCPIILGDRRDTRSNSLIVNQSLASINVTFFPSSITSIFTDQLGEIDDIIFDNDEISFQYLSISSNPPAASVARSILISTRVQQSTRGLSRDALCRTGGEFNPFRNSRVQIESSALSYRREVTRTRDPSINTEKTNSVATHGRETLNLKAGELIGRHLRFPE